VTCPGHAAAGAGRRAGEKIIKYQSPSLSVVCYQSLLSVIRYQPGPAVTFFVADTVSRRIGAIPKSAAKPGSFKLSENDFTNLPSLCQRL